MSELDFFARFVGFAVMAAGALGLLGIVFAGLLKWWWGMAKAAGMLRDWAKWNRGVRKQ